MAEMCLIEETIIFIDALTAIFTFIYPFWPLVIFLGVRPLRQKDRPFLKRLPYAVCYIFIGWMVWAAMWGGPALAKPSADHDLAREG
jgi:hypothetical protein